MTCCRPWQWRAVPRLSGREARRTLTALKLETALSQGAAGAAGSAWRSSPYPPTPSTTPRSPCLVRATTGPSSGFKSKVRILVGSVGKGQISVRTVITPYLFLYLTENASCEDVAGSLDESKNQGKTCQQECFSIRDSTTALTTGGN